jgi:N6-adenosine-specific RNA methylase IME4
MTHDPATLFGSLPPSKFNVILCDFPWQFKSYDREGVPQRAEEQHYETMTVADGMALPVGDLATSDAALFMWSTSSHIEHCFDMAKAWGFRYSSKAFCWAKLNKHAEENQRRRFDHYLKNMGGEFDVPQIADLSNWFMGMGYGSRRNTEDCWLFTRGKPERRMFDVDGVIKKDQSVRELIVAPVGEHSRKPAETYDRIERMFDGPYLELFARNSRIGWQAWGNETGKFDAS